MNKPRSSVLSHPLSLSFTNIHSLLPKRDLVRSFLEDSSSDILVLTETWLNPDIVNKEVLDNDKQYNIYRRDRTGKRGGGFLVAVNKNIVSSLVHTNSALEIVWVACSSPSTQILLGACYRPPDDGPSFVEQLRESLSEASKQNPANHIYLFGDFSFPNIDWPLLSSSCNAAKDFINLTLDFNLFQVITKPTRGSNILDLLLTSDPGTVRPITQIDGFSDHNMLQLQLNIPLTFLGVTVKNIHDYSNAKFNNINAELEVFFNETFLPSFSSRSVNENWILFRDKISVLVDKYVPLVKITNDKAKPWFNKNLKQLRNKKKRLYISAKRLQTQFSWAKYTRNT